MKTFWKNDQVPEAPYYAVIFISRKGEVPDEYHSTDDQLMQDVQLQAGFLGYTSISSAGGGVFISYWKDETAIESWKQHSLHLYAKGKARSWYQYYHSMVCRVESSRLFEKNVASQL